MKKANSLWLSFVYASRWFLACSLLAVAPTASATPETLELEKRADFYRTLANYTDAFIDDSLAITIDDVIENPSFFQSINTKYIDLGPSRGGRVWLRSAILNADDSAGTWRVDINRQYYQSLDVFVVGADKSISHILESKISDSFNDRVIKDRMLGVDLTLDAHQAVEIYISFTSVATTFIPLGIGTIEATIGQHAREHTINWVFNGALIVLVAISLLMMPITGWRISIAFSLYIFSGFIYIFHADGYTFVHLWPDYMHLNDSINLRLMVILPAFGLVFSRVLFDFKKHAPAFNLYVWVYISIAGFVAVFTHYLYQYQPFKVLALLIVPIGAFNQFAASIIALRLGLQGAGAYFLGILVAMFVFFYALVAHLMPGHISLDSTLDFGHFSFVAEGFAFSAAITARLVSLREERDRALQSELIATREKLELSTKLQDTQEDYIRARKTADMRKNQLSTVSHDLQQPLASLRRALNRIEDSGEGVVQQMHNAFDYLEGLALEQVGSDRSNLDSLPSVESIEVFPVSVVLNNVREMFANEAEERGLSFRYRPSTFQVKTDPILLMRLVSNLVSNSIKHSVTGGVLLAVRRRCNTIRIEIWDTGKGMSVKELEQSIQPYEKGNDSLGSGLGLAIVHSISEQLGFKFEMYSRVGTGSVAFLYLPQDT